MWPSATGTGWPWRSCRGWYATRPSWRWRGLASFNDVCICGEFGVKLCEVPGNAVQRLRGLNSIVRKRSEDCNRRNSLNFLGEFRESPAEYGASFKQNFNCDHPPSRAVIRENVKPLQRAILHSSLCPMNGNLNAHSNSRESGSYPKISLVHASGYGSRK